MHLLLPISCFFAARHMLGLCADYARSRLTGRSLDPYMRHIERTNVHTFYFALGLILSRYIA